MNNKFDDGLEDNFEDKINDVRKSCWDLQMQTSDISAEIDQLSGKLDELMDVVSNPSLKDNTYIIVILTFIAITVFYIASKLGIFFWQ